MQAGLKERTYWLARRARSRCVIAGLGVSRQEAKRRAASGSSARISVLGTSRRGHGGGEDCCRRVFDLVDVVLPGVGGRDVDDPDDGAAHDQQRGDAEGQRIRRPDLEQPAGDRGTQEDRAREGCEQ